MIFKIFEYSLNTQPEMIFVGIYTGNSFLEALILASTNPQNDKRLFIELRVQYKLRTCWVHT